MGFLERNNLNRSIPKTVVPVQEPPPPDEYVPDNENTPDIPDFPTEPHEPEEQPYKPFNSNPFGDNPFPEEDEGQIREVTMPNETLDGINEEVKRKAEQVQKEIEEKKREAEQLTDEKGDGETLSSTPEIKNEVDNEEAKKLETVSILGMQHVIEDCTKAKAEDNDDKSCDTKEAREPYSLNAMATVPKVTFAKPHEAGGGLKKLLIFLCACLAVGVFFGVKANSYWVFSGMTAGGLDSCFSWLMEEGLKTTMSPFSPAVFGTGVAVGAGILGIIGLFIYLDSDQKKRSRVGHEHGTTHIAVKKDFTVYKNKFMED